jgi:hypothetical protein
VRNRHQFLVTSYYIGWTMLLSIFVAIGGREIWTGSGGKFLAPGSYASTDAYLAALLNVPNASERCLEVMSKLYGKRAIFYFCPPREPRGDFVYGVLGYLSWPQDMRKVEIGQAELAEKLGSIDRSSASAFIFFELQSPSEFSRGWHVGPNLLVVPLQAPP